MENNKIADGGQFVLQDYKMKIFRFSFIVPAVIIIALIFAFFVLLFDGYLKKGLIAAGETAFGAKVEIASVKTSFKNFSVRISGIKIGDKDAEFKNLADIDAVSFNARFIPLLSKKFIIDEMSVRGFK